MQAQRVLHFRASYYYEYTYCFCVCVCKHACFNSPLQDLTPLELVKAARKAHGESTDVGTEDDLWGSLKDNEELQTDDTLPRVTMSMPTHLEIGLLPPTTIPHAPGQ